MIEGSYAVRLLCLILAVFFLLHLAAAVTLRVITPLAVRIAERLPPHRASAMLAGLRLLPALLALLAVLGLLTPSYLKFEPELDREAVGPLCLGGAFLGAALWMNALRRGFRAIAEQRRCSAPDRELVIVDSAVPFFHVAGLWRCRIVVSRRVMNALAPDEFAAAIAHERAHFQAGHNLIRLTYIFLPGFLPFYRGFERLEQAWARFAEHAADERATQGDPQRAVELAGALVRVARLGSAPEVRAAIPLIGGHSVIAERVDRLLTPEPPSPPPRWAAWMPAGIALAPAAALALCVFADQSRAHRLLEVLIR